MASNAPLRAVHLIPKDAEIKRLCFDPATMALRPNLVLVDRRGSVVFEINELGLKGAPRDPARKLAVVWGDSVVFGARWSWPPLIDAWASGYQFLNGGIEGDPYDNILRRAARFNREHEVALNIVMLGWHPFDHRIASAKARARSGTFFDRLRRSWPLSRRAAAAWPPLLNGTNQRVRADLTGFLQQVPNTALATMPTALNPRIVDRDLSAFFRRGDPETDFTFAGDLPYSVELQRRGFDHIAERNAIIREVAHAAGTRLVDLAAEFDTQGLADFREDFHDMVHLRPRAYPKAAAAVYAGIKDLL